MLQHVEKAGNKGVWLKILRLQTRLQSVRVAPRWHPGARTRIPCPDMPSQAQLKKILKNLAKRKLVKSVKSITAYREVWVAWGVEPDKTVTGGKWYTDSKLDTCVALPTRAAPCHTQSGARTLLPRREFITHLSEAVYVALQSGPRSRAQLLEMLAQVGVSSVALTPSDVQDILDILVYDGMVEEMPTYVSAGPAVPSTLAAARGLAGAGTPSAAAGGAGTTAADRKKYRVSKQVEHYNFMCQAPCGACPVRQHCHPGGTISPEKCVYMDAWLFDG